MIPHIGADCWYDVEAGKMAVDFNNIPEKLPICIDDATVAGWSIDMYVCGEYAPENLLTQVLEVYQIRKINGYEQLHYQGKMDITWTYEGQNFASPVPGMNPCCEIYKYTGTFSNVVGYTNPIDDDPGIDLLGNHVPTITHVDGCDDVMIGTAPYIDCSWLIEPDPAYNDSLGYGKEVCFKLESVWAGCDKDYQHFTVISFTIKKNFPKKKNIIS